MKKKWSTNSVRHQIKGPKKKKKKEHFIIFSLIQCATLLLLLVSARKSSFAISQRVPNVSPEIDCAQSEQKAANRGLKRTLLLLGDQQFLLLNYSFG